MCVSVSRKTLSLSLSLYSFILFSQLLIHLVLIIWSPFHIELLREGGRARSLLPLLLLRQREQANIYPSAPISN